MKTSKLQTAKILAFPIDRRRAKTQKHALDSVNEFERARASNLVDFGSCWYHDEAISHVLPIEKK